MDTASFPSQFVVLAVVTRMHAHVQIRDIDQSQASRSREGGDDDEFLSLSQSRSNEMEVVGASPPLSKRPMLDGCQCLCHCRNATGKIKVLSKPFSAGGPFGGSRRYCYQSYTNKTLSANLQQDEAKAESESNEGNDSPTCMQRSQPWVERRRY